MFAISTLEACQTRQTDLRDQDASFSLPSINIRIDWLALLGAFQSAWLSSVLQNEAPSRDSPPTFRTWHLCIVCVSVFESLLKPAFDTVVHSYVKCFPLPSTRHPLLILESVCEQSDNAAAAMPRSLSVQRLWNQTTRNCIKAQFVKHGQSLYD